MDSMRRIRHVGSTKTAELRSHDCGHVLWLLLILGALCSVAHPVAAQSCGEERMASGGGCGYPVRDYTAAREGLPGQGNSSACVGDCSGDGAVTVDELIVGASIALGELAVDACVELDADHDATVSVDEIVVGVMRALAGCSAATPAPTRTATPPPSATPGVCGQPVPDEVMAACRAARTEASCLANGGEWRMSFIRNWYCACPTGMAGCPCTDSSDCPCVAEHSRVFPYCERVTGGTCLARIPFDGCYCLFDSNGEATGLCWDP